MKLRYAFLITYSVITTLFLIKSKIDRIIEELTESEDIAVKVWYEGKKYVYDRQSRLIFIGGVPRSGTTMLRAMVEGHPSVTCGEETGVILDLIKAFGTPLSRRAKSFLTVSGVTEKMIDDNVAEFVLKILTKHSRPNLLLCNKDPVVLNYTAYVHRLFPNSKFILIIRDGRASVNSLIKHEVLEHNMGQGVKTIESGLMAWNFTIANMVEQCFEVGPHVCMILYYELLVNDPVHWLRRVANFLNVPYFDSMFNYRPLIGDKFDVFIGGSSNITQDISNKSFYNWVPNIPKNVTVRLKQIAPMLEVLGYDIENELPNYTTLYLLKGYQSTTQQQIDINKKVMCKNLFSSQRY